MLELVAVHLQRLLFAHEPNSSVPTNGAFPTYGAVMEMMTVETSLTSRRIVQMPSAPRIT
jgi:hypothetical protein